MTTQSVHISGWAALINGGIGIVGVVLLILFFTVGEPFGTWNDLTSLLWTVTLLPVVFNFYRLGAGQGNPWRIFATVTGLLGLTAVFILQILLVLKVISIWQQTYFITAAYGAIGVWMIILSRIGHNESVISTGLAGFGIAIGIGWILATVGIWIGGFPPADSVSSMSDMSQFNVLTIVGVSLIFLGYFVQPIWAIWLGRLLLSSK